MQGFLAVFLLLIPVVSCSTTFIPVDCHDRYERGFGHSGVYNIFPAGPVSPTQVYCDMDGQSEGAKWTVCITQSSLSWNYQLYASKETRERKQQVIQRRMDGTINFYRGWEQYKAGFGQASGEYWLGLDIIHTLTTKNKYQLRIDMEDFTGAKVFAHYNFFSVGPEEEGYPLNVTGFVDGGVGGDSLDHHNGNKFSTFDKDQDIYSGNCAKSYTGAWWFGECHNTNPNGLYLWGASVYGMGINWSAWKGYEYSLKAITMKIRPSKQD